MNIFFECLLCDFYLLGHHTEPVTPRASGSASWTPCLVWAVLLSLEAVRITHMYLLAPLTPEQPGPPQMRKEHRLTECLPGPLLGPQLIKEGTGRCQELL